MAAGIEPALGFLQECVEAVVGTSHCGGGGDTGGERPPEVVRVLDVVIHA